MDEEPSEALLRTNWRQTHVTGWRSEPDENTWIISTDKALAIISRKGGKWYYHVGFDSLSLSSGACQALDTAMQICSLHLNET